MHSDMRIDMNAAMERLDTKHRSALILWLSGWTQKEIAARMNVHQSTVSRWIQQSVHILSTFFTVVYE